MRFALVYGRGRRAVPIHADCAEAARELCARIQADPCYIQGAWTPAQWAAICDAFELDLALPMRHPDTATCVLSRAYARNTIRVNVPSGLFLEATLHVERFLCTEPCRARTRPVADIRAFFRSVTVAAIRLFAMQAPYSACRRTCPQSQQSSSGNGSAKLPQSRLAPCR